METSTTTPLWLVVMGVSGCGKSSLGQVLAAELGLPLVEGDDFHPEANIRKMSSGIALDDADRAGWLARLGEELAVRPGGAVLTCSALKRAYRDRLRAAVPVLRFVYMRIGRDEALARVRARTHFFSASLVDSQFQTLEPPEGEPDMLAVRATDAMSGLCAQVRHWLVVQGLLNSRR
ncbi:MAG: gluconokinase [Xenophilus sp.]